MPSTLGPKLKRLVLVAACLLGCDPRAAAGCGDPGKSEAPAEPGKVALAMDCTGPLTLEPAKHGTPVRYGTKPGATSDLDARVVTLRLPVKFAGDSLDLDVRLHVGNPTPGTIELPIGGDSIPRATVALGDSDGAAKPPKLTVTRADGVLSGVLTLDLRGEAGAADQASCTIKITDVPFSPFLDSQVMWGDERLSLISASGPPEGPDNWTVNLPDDVGGALTFTLQGPPALGVHELPTDAIQASIKNNDAVTIKKATLTVRHNAYGTYDADVDAVLEHDGASVAVRGMLKYMSTGEIRSADAAEARDAVNVARGAGGEESAKGGS